MMTREEMTDICCMELSACGTNGDIRKIYRRCADIAQNRGCSDRVFSDAWNNAYTWFMAVYAVSAGSADVSVA